MVLQWCPLWPNWITFPGIPFPVPFWLGLATRGICMRFASGSKATCMRAWWKSLSVSPVASCAHFQGSVAPMVWAAAGPAPQNSACMNTTVSLGLLQHEGWGLREGTRPAWVLVEPDADSSWLQASGVLALPHHPFFHPPPPIPPSPSPIPPCPTAHPSIPHCPSLSSCFPDQRNSWTRTLTSSCN